MDEKETGRVEAFSDGVFAVAITLLVLNIQPPPLSDPRLLLDGWPNSGLAGYLAGQWPTLLAFITSFATVGVMWMNHHRVFKSIVYVDHALLALNLLLLLVIVFFPYPTALVALQYAAHPGAITAAVFYSGVNFILAICFNLLWRYATYKNRLVSKNADPLEIASISRQYLYGPFVNLFIFALAWFNAAACIGVTLLVAVFFALPVRLPSRPPEKQRQEA
ncbi:MAG: TMEM175 family protein [Ktedonobacteraceae bacterium]